MITQDRFKASPQLNGRHQHTYEAVFRHPVAHNLEWHDVWSLLSALANVTEEHNGSLHVTRNGQTVILHAPKRKNFATIEHILAIRHFLEQSVEASISPPVTLGLNLLVVIDEHEAKIYQLELHRSIPRQIAPHDPHGFGRHLRSDTSETDGKRMPERKGFYEGIAATLRGADRILIFGSGKGESIAMEQLLDDLKHNHSDVANQVAGTIVVDGQHLTEDQLLAQAREFFASKEE